MLKQKVRKIKKFLKYGTMLKAEPHNHTISFFGSRYGGFNVATDIYDSEEKLVVYSFGIGEDLTFSETVLDSFDCDIYAFDPTPKSIKYVETHSLSKNSRFHFYPYGISDKDETGQFHLPVNEEYVSGSLHAYDGVKTEAIPVKLKTLKTITNMLGHDHIDLLKMDVEGTEFQVIPGILGSGLPIKQVCVEVHDRFFEDGRGRLENMVQQFTKCGYALVSVSENYEELTFVR